VVSLAGHSHWQLLAASRRGIPAARLLHFARRAERTLVSYERVGWVDMPAVTTHGTEIRPAADCGPILVCLDTSGSMAGTRETVAKALTLECMRQARTQRRGCYAYAFSGPGQCVEFELSFTAKGMADLLQFLAGSFHGGTDVDEPLKRSLERLQGHPEWANADVLLVTDGEIPPPSEELLASLSRATQDMGLKVHGLLVGEEHGTEREAATQEHSCTARFESNVCPLLKCGAHAAVVTQLLAALQEPVQAPLCCGARFPLPEHLALDTVFTASVGRSYNQQLVCAAVFLVVAGKCSSQFSIQLRRHAQRQALHQLLGMHHS
jgi:hypothetical protein